MLDDRGKTAAYLLYSLTRIRSIVRTAGVDTAQFKGSSFAELNLEHPKEIKLAKQLIRSVPQCNYANDLIWSILRWKRPRKAGASRFSMYLGMISDLRVRFQLSGDPPHLAGRVIHPSLMRLPLRPELMFLRVLRQLLLHRQEQNHGTDRICEHLAIGSV